MLAGERDKGPSLLYWVLQRFMSDTDPFSSAGPDSLVSSIASFRRTPFSLVGTRGVVMTGLVRYP